MGLGMTNGPGKAGYYAKQAYDTAAAAMAAVEAAPALVPATSSNNGYMTKEYAGKLDGIEAGANNYTHPDSGVTADTYQSVTVDAKGHVTAATKSTAFMQTLNAHGTDAETVRTLIGAGTGKGEASAISMTGYEKASSPAAVTESDNVLTAIGKLEAAGINYAKLASPAFTGTPTAPTATTSTNNTQIATTAFVKNVVNGIDLSAYAKLASPALTGTPTAPTASSGTNTTQIATTAFVQSAHDTALSSGDFTIIYPNGGTEANPANVSPNSRYVMSNPFPDYYVKCVAELLSNNRWEFPGYTMPSHFTVAAQNGDGDIIIQTGGSHICAGGANEMGATANFSNVDSMPCRVKVWKIGKIVS